MAVERYGSKTDVVVKLVLVFFIALLSFSIGTFVGKKFSDNQHKLAQLEPGSEHGGHAVAEEHGTKEGEEGRAVASVNPDSHDVIPEKALNDEEIAKLAEEFVTDDEKPAAGHGESAGHGETVAHGAAPAKHGDAAKNEHEAPTHGAAPAKHEAAKHGEEPAKHEAPAKGHAPASTTHDDHATPAKHDSPTKHEAATTKEALKPAQRMAEGHSAVVENPAKPASRIPSSLPKEVASSAVGKFTVQVAAYGTEKEAQTMAADLKTKGFSAFYVSATVKGTTWYRVSVGLFSTQKEADAYKKDLMSRAKVSSAIVQKVTSAE